MSKLIPVEFPHLHLVDRVRGPVTLLSLNSEIEQVVLVLLLVSCSRSLVTSAHANATKWCEKVVTNSLKKRVIEMLSESGSYSAVGAVEVPETGRRAQSARPGWLACVLALCATAECSR
jgi:hypothetical protein